MNINFDRLKQSNNPIERICADIIELYFPNYEFFWSKYLEPLRDEDGDWKYNMLGNLEELGISQYGILKSTCFISISRNCISVGDKYQNFKNIYFHFGLIFDSINNFCRNLCIIRDKLEIEKIKRKLKKTNDILIKGFEKWVIKSYCKKYNEMVDSGKPIYCYPHNDIDYLKLLIPKDLRKNFRKHIDSIKAYRNFYIHTPGVDIIKSYGRLRAIKKEHVNDYRRWSKIKKCLHGNPYHEHFSDPKEIVENDLKETLRFCDSIWERLIKHMDEITRHPKYEEMSSNYQGEK